MYGGKEKQILHDIDLDIEEGTTVALIGKSGCGKTTLLHAIAGLIPIESGSDIGLSLHQSDIGVVLQKYSLFPWKTADGKYESRHGEPWTTEG